LPSGFLAHGSSRDGSRTDTVADHLRSVAERAAEYAKAFGADGEARLAGLLHDIGKYGELFQMRLLGQAEHVDHWSAGAWLALQQFRHAGLAAALAVQGHHIGLQRIDKAALVGLKPTRWNSAMHDQWQLSEPDAGVLMRRFRDDALDLVPPNVSLYNPDEKKVAAMMDVRMLFSALVDADFIETEAHFKAIDSEKRYRDPGPTLDPVRALEQLFSYITRLTSESKGAAVVNQLRADILRACLEAADGPQGQYTLTAPTGSGKTLAMLAFALEHAAKHELRRVVMVIPYLNIIDQTAEVFRDVLQPVFGPEYVLEHHSLVGTRGEDDVRDASEDRQRELSENWDAPVIVTTSVQMLESLFANRPSACRKLHRLARSVILFDEVQTLRTDLAVPTLAALARLVERYGATVVFATASQPAFDHLGEHVKKWCSCGWQPSEIVPRELDLSIRARRTKVEWPDFDVPIEWEELADRLAGEDCVQVLCVVNLKRHALLLFQRLRERLSTDEGLFHVSTSMCPAHRRKVIEEVRQRLASNQCCRLVATQCVEAGVDLDFPMAFRAWGPLESIAQVAGRCNRNGRFQLGSVHVFIPRDDKYPSGDYRQAASVARQLFVTRGGQLDLDDPTLFQDYYRQLYAFARPEDRNQPLSEAIQLQDFVKVAELYRLIPDVAVNILVPYDDRAYQELCERVRRDGISLDWIRAARPHTIGVYRPKHDAPIRRWLEPVTVAAARPTEDWFVYLKREHYDYKTGLNPPGSMECLIG